MLLKAIPVGEFFTAVICPNPPAICHEPPQLQAFFSPDQDFTNSRTITLTDNYLLLSDRTAPTPTHFLPLDAPLKFRRIVAPRDGKIEGGELLGFDLVNAQLESSSIYIQYGALAKIWLKWLSRNLTELDFDASYRKIRQIGKGTSAAVWEVQRKEDGKVFAAKAFSKEYLAAKEERQLGLENEISLLREMDHPNVLRLEAVLQSPSAIYLICDHLTGGNILQRINLTKGFSLGQVRTIMRGVLSGLQYLHKFDIAHRDIKLENIIFREGNALDPVIADFGLATFTDDEPYAFYRCGTPGFVAPEIIRMKDNRRVRVPCDIFSAGVVFHILLTNKYLFEGTGHKETYSNNVKADFDLDAPRYAALDRPALDLLRRMLTLRPSERITAEQALQCSFVGGCWGQKEEVSPAGTEAGEYVL